MLKINLINYFKQIGHKIDEIADTIVFAGSSSLLKRTFEPRHVISNNVVF